ncbi:hypothetical protein ACROAE_05535 [Shewanella sp. MF05960]|uniref:hypothetical protein n=1 Tax=Shewanella sp. MF05960 TaxID=3434874 RepID=UPI003D7A589B
MSNNPLTHYEFLSNQAIVLPTELLQVGFFRNNEKQNIETIKHNLSKQVYQLEEHHCDTFVETPLFSMLLVEYHNYYLQPNNTDNDKGVVLSLNKGTKIFKQLKMKGNYTIAQLIEKVKRFINKFRVAQFYVDDVPITVFEDLFINELDNTLRFDFHEDFIDYLNERGKSLTFIQITDFVAIKRKTQVPIFLIIQSLRNLKQPFFTKRYITDILGIKGDQNKKLSVAFNNLKEKHVLDYEKEVCHLPGVTMQFSRFNIKNVDTAFAEKMQQDKSKTAKATGNTLKPVQSEAIEENAPEAQQTQITANSPICDTDNQTSDERKGLNSPAQEKPNHQIKMGSLVAKLFELGTYDE